MCRMLAFASQKPLDIAPFLAHLARLSAHGNLVERWEKRPGGNHPDGWGIVFRGTGETRLHRSGEPAATDPGLAGIRGSADWFLGHVRYASDTATVNEHNAHPFLVDGIALGHNGTFRGRIGEEAGSRKVSDTLIFLERLAGAWKERTLAGLHGALERLLSDRELVGNYSAANMLILAGESLFALRNYRKDEGYYTLYLQAAAGRVTVASEALDDSPGWRPLDDGELVELSPQAPRSMRIRLAP